MKNIILFFFCVFMLSGCFSEDAPRLIPAPVEGSDILGSVLATIDPEHPGRGLADYPSDSPVDVPKSYAMILLGAEAEARSKKLGRINDFGVKAGNWLIENSDANNDGIIGWGVPIAWDAYGDGSVNPENTEYSISTAIVVDALLGWVQYVDSDKKLNVLALVDKALKPYLSENMRTPAGLLPYSLLVHDRKYDTFNSAVYLAGQMQRYSNIVQDAELKESLAAAADSTMLALLNSKKVFSESGSWYWNYSIQENNPNDLPHAGYIVEGVLTYVENNGRLSQAFDKGKIFNHLMDFFDVDGSLRGWPIFRPEIKTPPRLYDLSIAAQLMCRFKDRAAADLFLGVVGQYAKPAGGYLKYPRTVKENRQVAEYESYLYRALMSCGINERNYAQ